MIFSSAIHLIDHTRRPSVNSSSPNGHAGVRIRRLGVACATAVLLWAVWVGPAQAAPFVYVANAGSGNVSQFDGMGGLLSPLSPPTVSASTFSLYPIGVAVGPDGRSVYVSLDNTGGGNLGGIRQFDVSASGTLSQKAPDVTQGDDPLAIVVSPDGKSAYASGFSQAVSQYDIDTAGKLTPKTPATVPVATGGGRLAISPNGTSLYVSAGSEISQYTIGPGGQLLPKAPATVALPGGTAAGARGIKVNPDGASVYVADNKTREVAQFDVAAATGALTPKSPASVSTGVGTGPAAVAIAPNGKSVYVTDVAGNTVLQFDVGAGGALAPKTTPKVAAGSPVDVAVSPDSASVYVVNANANSVSQYAAGTDGALSAHSPALVPTGGSPDAVAVDPGPTAGPGPTPNPGPTGNPSPMPGPGQPHVAAGIAVPASPAKVSNGTASVTLSCPKRTTGCSGTLVLSVRQRVTVRNHGRRKTSTRTVTLGRAGFKVPAGAKRPVRVGLSTAGRRMLSHARRHRLGVTASVGSHHRSITLVQTVPKRRHHR